MSSSSARAQTPVTRTPVNEAVPDNLREWRSADGRAVTLIEFTDMFHGSPWRLQAEALGWDTLDLFGVDPDEPFRWVERQGLVPALALSSFKLTLELMAADCAILRSSTGSALRHSLRRWDGRRVPFWRSTALLLPP